MRSEKERTCPACIIARKIKDLVMKEENGDE
jgi:hypothetical protein